MSKVEPALSADEWREYAPIDRTLEHYAPAVAYDNPHGAAALALHGQPFGFTWDDVDRIRAAIVMEKYEARADDDETERLRAIADRIAALLPPRDQ